MSSISGLALDYDTNWGLGVWKMGIYPGERVQGIIGARDLGAWPLFETKN